MSTNIDALTAEAKQEAAKEVIDEFIALAENEVAYFNAAIDIPTLHGIASEIAYHRGFVLDVDTVPMIQEDKNGTKQNK